MDIQAVLAVLEVTVVLGIRAHPGGATAAHSVPAVLVALDFHQVVRCTIMFSLKLGEQRIIKQSND